MISIQDYRCYRQQQLLKLLSIEQLLVIAALILGFVSNSDLWLYHKNISTSLILTGLGYGIFTGLSMLAAGLYKRQMNMYLQEQYLRLAGAMIILFVLLNNVSYWFESFDLGKQTWFATISITYIFLLISRTIFSVLTKNHYSKTKTVIFGASNKALQLKNHIENIADLQTEILGYICKSGERDRMPRETIIDISLTNNSVNELLEFCLQNQVDNVVVAVDDRRNNFPLNHLLECKQNGIQITELMEFYEQHLQKVELSILDPSWIIYSNKITSVATYVVNKRLFDLVLATIVGILMFPLIVITMIMLKLCHGISRPILIKRSYLGQFNKPFINYHFNCVNKQNKVSWLGRAIQKLNLNSVFLLHNIVRGEISFVGPQLVEGRDDPILSKSFWFYKQRYSVKPGLLSWGYTYQDFANIKSDNEKINIVKNQLQYDLFYLNKASFLLDVLVLLHRLTTWKYNSTINTEYNKALI